MATIEEQVSNFLNFSNDPVSLDEELYAASNFVAQDLALDPRSTRLLAWNYKINIYEESEADRLKAYTVLFNDIKKEIERHLRVPQSSHRRYDELVDKVHENSLSLEEEEELTALAKILFANND